MSDPIVMRGILGWGNRKTGYEAYGPGGRWDNLEPGGGAHPRANPDGDLLGDALERAGAHEGATLLVVAVDRFGDTSILDVLARVAERADSPPTDEWAPTGTITGFSAENGWAVDVTLDDDTVPITIGRSVRVVAIDQEATDGR